MQQVTRPFWLKIRWNLILYSMLLAVIPLAVVSLFTVTRHAEQSNQQVFNQLESVTVLKTDQIERWLKENSDVIHLLMADETLHEALASADAAAENSTINRELATFTNAYPSINAIMVYDLTGRVVAASNPNDIGKQVSRQPYFSESLAAPDYLTHPPFYAIGTQELVLYGTFPLRDAAGELSRVAAFELDLSRLGEIMSERTGLLTTGETYLVSRQNNYLLTPSTFEGYVLTRAYHSEGIDRALDGESGSSTYNGYRDTQVMGVYQWIPELEAGLIAEVEEQEALAEATRTRNASIVAAAAAMILAALFGLFYASYMSQPIVALTQAATAVAAGDYAQVIKTNRRNEIGQLAEAFNSMTSQLRQLIGSLEDRVAARTRDLELAAEVSKEAATVMDPEVLLPRVAELTKQAFDLYHVSVFVLNPDDEILKLAAGTGQAGERMKQLNKRFNINSGGMVPKAARERRAVLINNTRGSRDHLHNPLLPNTQSEIALPMVVGESLIGVLDLQSEQADRFTPDDLRVLQTLADRIGVALRNAQLYTNAQEAQQRAEESDRVKSAFLASMSHELRTPLNAIINFSQFISMQMMGPINERQSETIKSVIESAEHLLALINDVLDISKIESGSLKLFVEDDVSLREITESVANTARGLLKDKPVALNVEIAPDLPLIEGDRQRILQIMLNVVSNACKFTKEGQIDLQVSQQDGHLQIAVADTGPGIAPEDYATVFEKFKQTNSGLRQGSGTGLGMPITRSLVEAHGGKIWLEGELGKGTTFTITLPVKSAAVVEVEAI